MRDRRDQAKLAQESNDDDLLSDIAAGSERAFTLLVARYADRVGQLAIRYTFNEADAQDIAQDVFLRVWQTADRWQPGTAQFSTWLHRATVNACIDHHRRKKRWSWLGLDNDGETEIAQFADPNIGAEEQMLGQEALSIAQSAIEALPVKQGMALTLSTGEGLSNQEIASAMGLSIGAVEQLLVRARRSLRNALTGHEK